MYSECPPIYPPRSKGFSGTVDGALPVPVLGLWQAVLSIQPAVILEEYASSGSLSGGTILRNRTMK